MGELVEVKPKKIGYFKKQHKNFKKNKGIILFLIPAILLNFLFGYIPMVGVLFAFKEKITPINWLYDFLTQPFTVSEVFTGRKGLTVDLSDTIEGCAGILEGKYDDLPEQAFFMVGVIDEAVQKAKEMKATEGKVKNA